MEEVNVVYEDEYLAVVNKPAGLVVTREGIRRGECLEDWVEKRWGETGKVIRHGIAHRLDRGTSGLVIVAKRPRVLAKIQSQFKKREVVKEYLALVVGIVVEKGEIKMPIGRSNSAGWGRFAVAVDGKMAMTKFTREGRYRKDGRDFSLLRVLIETGRTHQIRVHLSYMNWPIVGDRRYGGGEGGRIFLHAWKLAFNHPISGKLLSFELPLPESWLKGIREYEEVKD